MKKLLVGLLVLGSITAFAEGEPKQCGDTPRSESYIQNQDGKNYKLDLVYVFNNSARDLYLKIESVEKVETIGETNFLGKSKGQLSCLRQDRKDTVSGEACASYQCSIAVIQ